MKPDLAVLKWEIIRGAVFEQFGVDLNDELDRLHKIEEVAIDISRRTYVDDGVVAHVPFYKLYALRQALFGSDEEIVAALERMEE